MIVGKLKEEQIKDNMTNATEDQEMIKSTIKGIALKEDQETSEIKGKSTRLQKEGKTTGNNLPTERMKRGMREETKEDSLTEEMRESPSMFARMGREMREGKFEGRIVCMWIANRGVMRKGLLVSTLKIISVLINKESSLVNRRDGIKKE